VTALQFLPIMLLSLISGVIADRVPKHKLIIGTQTAAMVLAAIFGTLVATNAIQLWHIYVIAMLQGIINAVDNPARQAFAVELVGHDQIVNAIALNSMLFNGARIVGPAVAGLLIAQFGIAPVLYLNAVSFLAVLGGLLRMNPTEFMTIPARMLGSV